MSSEWNVFCKRNISGIFKSSRSVGILCERISGRNMILYCIVNQLLICLVSYKLLSCDVQVSFHIQYWADVKNKFRNGEKIDEFPCRHKSLPITKSNRFARIYRSHNTKLRSLFTSLHEIKCKTESEEKLSSTYLIYMKGFSCISLCKENAFYDKFFSLKRFINFEHKHLKRMLIACN